MNHSRICRSLRLRPGFTLIEALVSISIAAIAGSVLLVGIGSSIQATDEALQQTIACGMAEQLMDEVVGLRYMEFQCSAHDTVLQPGGAEAATGTRELFDDIDDYNGFRCSPPTDRWGIELGKDDGEGGIRHPSFQAPDGFFDRWRQEVDVYYVDAADPYTRLAAGQTSDYRTVEVRIMRDNPEGGSRALARLRRIVAYVPPL
ncbi:MAG: type II secretion system protein [Pirellulales bacterium]|nr:type II secretion system protein [Pirellulales bacterium]